jgi:hypothetical protein
MRAAFGEPTLAPSQGSATRPNSFLRTFFPRLIIIQWPVDTHSIAILIQRN